MKNSNRNRPSQLHMRLTDPRPVKMTDPEDELSNLFSLLVDDVGQVRVPTQRAKTAIKRRFDQLLTAHNLKPLVDEKFPVELPQLGKRHCPYHFKNGTGNVIEPETFELSTHQEITERACRIMIEGQELSIDFKKKKCSAGFPTCAWSGEKAFGCNKDNSKARQCRLENLHYIFLKSIGWKTRSNSTSSAASSQDRMIKAGKCDACWKTIKLPFTPWKRWKN